MIPGLSGSLEQLREKLDRLRHVSPTAELRIEDADALVAALATSPTLLDSHVYPLYA